MNGCYSFLVQMVECPVTTVHIFVLRAAGHECTRD
jgi:hypothetical protein